MWTTISFIKRKQAWTIRHPGHTREDVTWAPHEDKTGSEYLGIKAIHYDGELSGIAQALEEAREVNMLTILTDSEPAISNLRKLDQGTAPPRSEIEARVLVLKNSVGELTMTTIPA